MLSKYKYISRIKLSFVIKHILCEINPGPAEALSLKNSLDPDQLASEEANWSGSALFVIQYMNLYEKHGSSNLSGWQLDVGVTS